MLHPDSGFAQAFYNVLEYFLLHYIEIVATVTGLIYLIYSVAENKLLWFFGLITSLLYVYICFAARIYADMGINVYYVIISVYGWIYWSGGSTGKSKEVPVKRLQAKLAGILLSITIILFIFIAFILQKFTDSDIALWDAFTTAASITATWMLAKKIIEHWLVWIVVDSVSVGLYIFKGLYPTSLLFFVYTTLAIVGFIEWRKTWIREKAVAVELL